jgi:hypothetical protein
MRTWQWHALYLGRKIFLAEICEAGNVSEKQWQNGALCRGGMLLGAMKNQREVKGGNLLHRHLTEWIRFVITSMNEKILSAEHPPRHRPGQAGYASISS